MSAPVSGSSRFPVFLLRVAGRIVKRRLLAFGRALRDDWAVVCEMYDQIERERRRHG
jgi:hypothetical protein